MTEQNPAFPELTDADAAQVAATLASAACSMMAPKGGLSPDYALHIARRMFAEQYAFLQARKWEEETDRFSLSKNLDLR